MVFFKSNMFDPVTFEVVAVGTSRDQAAGPLLLTANWRAVPKIVPNESARIGSL